MTVTTVEECRRLSDLFEERPAQELVAWALEKFHPRIAAASSFGAEDVVVIDMLAKIRPGIRVITLDTGRLPQETYAVMEAIRVRYGCGIEVYFPEAPDVEAMVNEHGPNPFYRSVELRKLCCGIRKVQPLRRALLLGLSAWISGLRREQAPTRAHVAKVELDEEHGGILKLNPLAEWTSSQVWDYIRANDIPYNALHDRGYLSIGCAPCTRAVQPGEDPRAGRWWWEQDADKECGLHPVHAAPLESGR